MFTHKHLAFIYFNQYSFSEGTLQVEVKRYGEKLIRSKKRKKEKKEKGLAAAQHVKFTLQTYL